ncbi:MAG: hypothetical protein BAJALOKI2v1_100026 [Promethearchaeota archaeon]|nr:MAG: hypothetical protein BAJALOKI2v1_100026 [Candidatus Lokiarchaeota archaeon]
MQIYENNFVENENVSQENIPKEIDADDEDFYNNLANDYLHVKIGRKQEKLEEYISAYDSLKNKDSFNAHYLRSLIDQLRTELS